MMPKPATTPMPDTAPPLEIARIKGLHYHTLNLPALRLDPNSKLFIKSQVIELDEEYQVRNIGYGFDEQRDGPPCWNEQSADIPCRM